MDYIIYFIITIAILVFVHEFGHFAAAKLSKMRVDVFALGFGKRLFGYNKLSGFTFGDLPKDFDGQGNTDYRLSLLPLGGYVKIAGMVDESFDTKFADSEPKPYEFRAKKTLPKLFVISAGVMMNLTLTILIFWGINFFQGKQVAKTTTINTVESGSFAEKLGFNSFDRIISINGEKIENWDDIIDNLLLQNTSKDVSILLERNGFQKSIKISRSDITTNSQHGFFLNYYPTEVIIDQVMKDSPAQKAGFKTGDLLYAINGITIKEGKQVNNIIKANLGKELSVVLFRDKDSIKTQVKADASGLIGISHGTIFSGEVEYRTYGVFGSFTRSVENIGQYTVLTFSMLKNVITGRIEFKEAFGGPIKIAQFAAKSADSGAIPFLYFLAILSLSLAIINILPFPVLDGGHFVIILLEGLFRKELPIKIKIAIQNTGFVILLLLMAFILYNDLISL